MKAYYYLLAMAEIGLAAYSLHIDKMPYVLLFIGFFMLSVVDYAKIKG